MASAIAVIPRLSPLIEMLAKELRQVLITIYSLMERAQEVISELEERGSECEAQVRESKERFAKVLRHVRALTRRLKDFFFFGRKNKNEIEKIKEQSISSDNRPLKEYIEQLMTHFSRIEGSYVKFTKSCNEAEKSCAEGIKKCRKAMSKSRGKKIATRAVGGTVAAGAVAATAGAGVAFSVVAGLFTFGVGTAVGLAITGAVTAGVGAAGATGAVAVGVGTHLLAERFLHSENLFKELGDQFGKIKKGVSDSPIKDMCSKVKEVNLLRDNLKDIEQENLGQDTFFKLVDLFFRNMEECHTAVLECEGRN